MQIQKRKQQRRSENKRQDTVSANASIVEAGHRMKGEIDKLVDDINTLLKANADEFVGTRD